MTATANRPYALVSTDGHAGASLQGYRDYLASEWHDEFDAWASTFKDTWSMVDDGTDPDRRFGVSSFMSPVNWDSDRRNSDLESQGIGAEVIYPNTVPPFYPTGVISAPAPQTKEAYDRRWAGVQAHNRWLVDFCAALPKRRIGLAQVFGFDIDDAVGEVRVAHERGLKGILLPGQHFHGLSHFFEPKWDKLWRVCEELSMPIHIHAILPSDASSEESGLASAAVGMFETFTMGKRPLSHFMLGGVFDRFPDLQLVFTEIFTYWMPDMLKSLDRFVEMALSPDEIAYSFAHEAMAGLKRKPSEYFSTNCFAASPLTELDIQSIKILGPDRVMWGADYPHHEGVFPYTTEALRINFSDFDEPEVRSMTSLNAIDLYNLDADLLQGIADKIGPTPAELAVPLPVSEWPKEPCPTFNPSQARADGAH